MTHEKPKLNLVSEFTPSSPKSSWNKSEIRKHSFSKNELDQRSNSTSGFHMQTRFETVSKKQEQDLERWRKKLVDAYVLKEEKERKFTQLEEI